MKKLIETRRKGQSGTFSKQQEKERKQKKEESMDDSEGDEFSMVEEHKDDEK